jgi:LysM repeat protein
MEDDINNTLMSLFDETPVESLRPQARPDTGFKPTTKQQVGVEVVDLDFALLSLFEDQAPVVTGQAPSQASYEIKAGDTLEQIAISGGYTLPDLLAVNPQITDPGKLSLNQKITIPTEEQITRPFVTQPDLPGKSQDILSFISKGEGGYEASNRGTRDGDIVGTQMSTVINGKPLSQSTIQEIKEAQDKGLFAVGRYQFIPETFNLVVDQLGLPDDAVFTQEVQDRMGTQLLFGSKRTDLASYLRGENDSLDAAMLDFAKEWASVPNPKTGKSYYASSGNKAQHTIEETKQILQSARAAFSEGEN